MILDKLVLKNYRNYTYLEQKFSPYMNILIGANAQGKTNLLEAVYYLTMGKTYRLAKDDQLLKWNEKIFEINGFIKNKNGEAGIEISFNTQNTKNKEIRINGLKIGKQSDLLGNFTAVLFAPEDLNFIKGPPSDRRKTLDNDISQVSPSYFIKLQKYYRLLNQRNHLLKKGSLGSSIEFEIWNEQFLNAADDIIVKRMNFLEKMIPLTRLSHRKLTVYKENIEIKYLLNKRVEVKKGDNITDILKGELKTFQKEELEKRVTLWGPHRDDLKIILNGKDLRFYGSQGQHRTAVLALKIAEIEFFKAESGEYPVLLLDDVLSELDQERRTLLFDSIRHKQLQCFITTTEDILNILSNNVDLKKFNVNNGILK